MTARAVLEVLLITALHGTALAAIAWLLTRTVLRRARPGLIAALWTVVLVKFVVPFGPALPYSLSDVLAALRADAPTAAAPIVVRGEPVVAAASTSPVAFVFVAIVVAWLAVALAIGARSIRRARAAHRAARALPVAPPHLVTELSTLARRIGAPVPALRLAPHRAAAPHVVGILRPVVVLPAALAADHRAVDRAAVLSHELAHLRRRDPWIAVVQAFAGALLWWWPVVALVNRRIAFAREAACDAWAVSRGPLPREQYARLLLSFARAPAMATGAAFAARAGGLEPRIDAVLDRRVRAGVGPAGGALLAIWVLVGLGGARSAAAHGAAPVCTYTPEVAGSLLASYPEADLDGDGTLSRAEACELQAELRKRPAAVAAEPAPSAEDAAVRAALAEPICCNCGDGEGNSSPPASSPPPLRDSACVVEGDAP